MQISSLLSRYLDTSAVRHGTDMPESNAAAPADKPATDTSSSAANSAAFRQVLSQYDVTSISPRQFSEMLQNLRKAGAISDQQYQDLSQVRSELDQAGIEPDERVDLVQFYADRLKKAQQSAADSQEQTGTLPAGQTQLLSTLDQRLQWLRKVATIQTDPAAGVNSVV